jgi:hypothetical protein
MRPGEQRAREWGGSGSSVLGVGGVRPGDAPSWHAATSFTSAYVQAVWKALVAALLISAALQSLVPRTWLLRLLNRRGRVASAGWRSVCWWSSEEPLSSPGSSRVGAVARLPTSGLTGTDDPKPMGTEWLRSAPARFGRALLRLSIVLVARKPAASDRP